MCLLDFVVVVVCVRCALFVGGVRGVTFVDCVVMVFGFNVWLFVCLLLCVGGVYCVCCLIVVRLRSLFAVVVVCCHVLMIVVCVVLSVVCGLLPCVGDRRVSCLLLVVCCRLMRVIG